MPKPKPEKRSKRKAWGCGGCLIIGIAGGIGIGVLIGLNHWQTAWEQDPFWSQSTVNRTTKLFVNSHDRLTGDRLKHYTEFSFQYPLRWRLEKRQPKDINYVTLTRCGAETSLSRCFPPIEQVSIAPFWGPKRITGDEPQLKSLIQKLSAEIAQTIPTYQKISEGKTTIGPYAGYEIRYIGSNDRYRINGQTLRFWGRHILLPDGKGNGVLLMLLASSLSTDVQRVEDVGETGEMRLIVRSFKFASPSTEGFGNWGFSLDTKPPD